jgi:hypothetical protein
VQSFYAVKPSVHSAGLLLHVQTAVDSSEPLQQVQEDPAVAATAQELADAAAANALYPPRTGYMVSQIPSSNGVLPHWISSRPAAPFKLWLDFTGSTITGTGTARSDSSSSSSLCHECGYQPTG